MRTSRGGIISQVLPGSIGKDVGLEQGDVLVSINGHPLRDVIDYRYYAAEEMLTLDVRRGGISHRLEIERDYNESLGLEFESAVFDRMRLCNNQCSFCFVRQMPGGMRRSLYLQDDDYRYSFLTGSFVTLTNLGKDDWQRIKEQHLSPLYVSIHATDPKVRRTMLGNPSAPDIIQQLWRLQSLGIEMHGQIVLLPGVNDGDILCRSIEELAEICPALATLAIVPVGLTRYCHRDLRPLNRQEARTALALIDRCAAAVRQRTGETWIYPSDELYLLAGRPLPDSTFYDRDDQRDNGVGLVRELLTDWQMMRDNLVKGSLAQRRITLVCGTLIAPILGQIVQELRGSTGLDAQLVPIVNRRFGETVTVSGLLTGQDVLTALQRRDLGERVYLPRAMFDATGRLALDDLTPATLAKRLATPVSQVSSMGEVVESLNREVSPTPTAGEG